MCLGCLPESLRPGKDLIDEAKELDRHYMLTRYLNFYTERALTSYYARSDAEKVVTHERGDRVRQN